MGSEHVQHSQDLERQHRSLDLDSTKVSEEHDHVHFAMCWVLQKQHLRLELYCQTAARTAQQHADVTEHDTNLEEILQSVTIRLHSAWRVTTQLS